MSNDTYQGLDNMGQDLGTLFNGIGGLGQTPQAPTLQNASNAPTQTPSLQDSNTLAIQQQLSAERRAAGASVPSTGSMLTSPAETSLNDEHPETTSSVLWGMGEVGGQT